MAHDVPYRVCFVCSGNICRSPMAEVVLRAMLLRAGLGDDVDVDSAGTGDWHVGERADLRALQALAASGYDGEPHRARQFDREWFAARDLLVALDGGHASLLTGMAPDAEAAAKVRLLRSFDPAAAGAPDLDVADPYYAGDQAFTDVLGQVEAACAGLVDHIRAELGRRPAAHPEVSGTAGR